MRPSLAPTAVCVFVLHRDRVLLLRRRRGAFQGAWTPVMGGIESGERAVETARREVREETGLEDLPLYTVGIVDTFYDPVRDGVVVVPFFVMRTSHETVTLDGAHDAFRWLPIDDAAAQCTFTSHRAALAEIRAAFIDAEPDPWRAL